MFEKPEGKSKSAAKQLRNKLNVQRLGQYQLEQLMNAPRVPEYFR